MAKTIKLQNKTREMLVFNLEHADFVEQEGENGVGKPESLTFLPRETKEVDETVLECAEVASALRRFGNRPSKLAQL